MVNGSSTERTSLAVGDRTVKYIGSQFIMFLVEIIKRHSPTFILHEKYLLDI